MLFWKKLLEKWCENRTGLTIPYIIGSQNFIEPNPNNDIKTMINEIIENRQIVVYLNHCPNIQEPVLGIKTVDYADMAGVFPQKSDGSKQEAFFICESIFSNHLPKKRNSKINEIVDWLVDKYSTLIANNKYSKNKGLWGDYLENEVKFIQSVFSDKN